jgi:oligosaccharide repeat unit polymerase
MIDTISSPWLPYAILVIVTGVARSRCGSWFAPAAFVGLVWSFFTGASLLLVDYPIAGRGMWMLVLLIVAIQLGALIAHELQPPGKSESNAVPADIFDSLITPCRRYGLLCAAVAMVGCIYFLFTSLDEFGLPFTPLGVLGVGARWTLQRYDDIIEPWSVRLLVTWLHPAGLLGGILFACSRKRLDRAIGVLSLLPSVAYGILTGARAPILLGLTCWIGGYVSVLCVKSHRRVAVFTLRRLVLFSLVAASMVGMFASIDAVRDSSWTHSFALTFQEEKIGNFMFASPAAFSDWYAHADPSGADWGGWTFAGAFDALHLKKRIVGRYTGTSNLIGSEITNVYTLFRGLIEDYTETGAILVSALIGGFTGWIYHRRSQYVIGSLLVLSAFYAMFIYSPIVSFFSFNGALLAWVVGWFVLTRKRSDPATLILPSLAGPEAVR